MGCFTATPTTTGMSACTKLPEIIRHTNPKATNCPSAVPQKRSHREVRKRCSVKRSPSNSGCAREAAGTLHLRLPASFGNQHRTSYRGRAAHSDGAADIPIPRRKVKKHKLLEFAGGCRMSG